MRHFFVTSISARYPLLKGRAMMRRWIDLSSVLLICAALILGSDVRDASASIAQIQPVACAASGVVPPGGGIQSLQVASFAQADCTAAQGTMTYSMTLSQPDAWLWGPPEHEAHFTCQVTWQIQGIQTDAYGYEYLVAKYFASGNNDTDLTPIAGSYSVIGQVLISVWHGAHEDIRSFAFDDSDPSWTAVDNWQIGPEVDPQYETDQKHTYCMAFGKSQLNGFGHADWTQSPVHISGDKETEKSREEGGIGYQDPQIRETLSWDINLYRCQSQAMTPGLSSLYFGPVLAQDARSCIVPVPGGPYMVTRADSVTLDGSQSYDTDGVIYSYQWDWKPASDCPDGTTLAAATKGGPSITIVALCGLTVTLTVTDGQGRTNSAQTTVNVVPRPDFDHTPVQYQERIGFPSPGGPHVPPEYPPAIGVPAGHPIATWYGGWSAPACDDSSPNSTDTGEELFWNPPFCPAAAHAQDGSPDWSEDGSHGYTIGHVDDPGGPFDGFVYIASADAIHVSRTGYINRYIMPDGPTFETAKANFYSTNKSDKHDVDGFIAAVKAHEGYGMTGAPLTGHMGRLVLELGASYASGGHEPTPLDPRRRIEPLFTSGDVAALKAEANGGLAGSARVILNFIKDPLPSIWEGNLEWWDAKKVLPSGWYVYTVNVPNGITGFWTLF